MPTTENPLLLIISTALLNSIMIILSSNESKTNCSLVVEEPLPPAEGFSVNVFKSFCRGSAVEGKAKQGCGEGVGDSLSNCCVVAYI